MALAVLLIALFMAPCAFAAPEPTEGPFATSGADWQGTAEFVRLAQRRLGTDRVHVTATLNYEELMPGDSLVVIFPGVELDGESLTTFLAEGGRVAILDDFGKSPSFLKRFGIHRVPPPLAPKDRLREDPDLAVAVPVIQTVAGTAQGRHPMTVGVERVITNHPVLLEHPDLTPVLEIPLEDGGAGTLAITGIISGNGRLLVVSDPSIFINLMLRYPGNRKLAVEMLDYLVSREVGRASSGRLLILTGEFTQKGHYGEPQDLTEEIMDSLSSLEEALGDIEGQGLPQALTLALAAVLAFWVLGSELRRNTFRQLTMSPAYARQAPLAAQTGASARAEILGAPQTSPLLSVIEMDAALREAVEQRLGINPSLRRAEFEERLATTKMGKDDAKELTALLETTRTYGASLAEGKPVRPSTTALKQLHDRSMKLLGAILEAEKKN